jgi:hypothetical protein
MSDRGSFPKGNSMDRPNDRIENRGPMVASGSMVCGPLLHTSTWSCTKISRLRNKRFMTLSRIRRYDSSLSHYLDNSQDQGHPPSEHTSRSAHDNIRSWKLNEAPYESGATIRIAIVKMRLFWDRPACRVLVLVFIVTSLVFYIIEFPMSRPVGGIYRASASSTTR